MNSFNIERYYIAGEDNIDVSAIPMLMRRKLSRLDKIALTVLSNIYDNNIDEIIFTSKNGEFDRLKEIITQYLSENAVSPIKFSSSVHNYSVSAFSQLNKITASYTALSAGEESLATGLVAGLVQKNKRTCVCYADNIGIGVVLSTKESGYDFLQIDVKSDEVDEFIKFLEGNRQDWNTNYGRIRRV